MSDFNNNLRTVRFEERIGLGIELPSRVCSTPVDVAHDLAEALRRIQGRSGALVREMNRQLGCSTHQGRERRLRRIYKAGGLLFETSGFIKEHTCLMLAACDPDGEREKVILVDILKGGE